MYEFIETLQSFHIAEVLISISVLMIFIDYYFPTDAPAHFGYFCFGAGMFFVVPLGVLASAVIGLGIWLLLAILHRFWFKRFLTNAPGTQKSMDETALASEES
jgi:hypothetical protein